MVRNSLRLPVLLLLSLAEVSASTESLPERPDVELFIAGSSAQDGALENLMRIKASVEGTPNICTEGSLRVFRAEIDGVRKRVFTCLTSGHVPGVPADVWLAVHKSSGGSGEGVTPVARREAIPYIDIASLAGGAACEEPTRVLYTGDLAAFTDYHDCDIGRQEAIPEAGISDIEPELIDPSAKLLEIRASSQLVWGLPVTKNLRNALQAVQGLVPADVAHDHPARETESAMPTLSSAQLASIFAGTLSEWTRLLDADGTPLPNSALLPEAPTANRNLAGTRPGAYRPDAETGKSVYICRRIASSGTQAAYEIHYLRTRCMPDAPGFVQPDDGSNTETGGSVTDLVDRPDPAGRIFAGVGSSDVRACLDAHEAHNRWAVGMFSTEVLGNNSSREFRHIRVDGRAPSLGNAREGRWLHVSEPTIQWRADSDLTSSMAGRVLGFIAGNIGQPRVIESLNSSFRHSWGQGGYLALAQPDRDTLPEAPIAGLSKRYDGRVRNCNVPLLVAPSSVAFGSER
jgi:hypothetical protein